MDGGGGCMRIRFPSPRRAVARLFNSKEKIKGKKKATVESHVRDCDSMRIINFSEDGRHGVGQSTDSSPSTIGSETFGQEVKCVSGDDESEKNYKVDPSLVSRIYGEWLIPLTKDVEVEYLLRRLD
ncbi:hypothetical protein F2Q68_00007234 [Brassica cretica]|uniref:chorismate mutase n=1 Tax=Brassica cretica TaxID=69181 RepID=A0A8S9KVQ5_BRACR|nr:hypothetical protein F2Q68_00007234 [Brassica cretica]